jgi:hypothetical protein
MELHPPHSASALITHLNGLLDDALKETFPSSDPVAINVELESPADAKATTASLGHIGKRQGVDRG